MSKEERRRRRQEERDEDLRQALSDISWLRTNGTACEWHEAQGLGDRQIREHILSLVDDSLANDGADAYVGERHLRIDRGDRIARLSALDKTEDGRQILREAFTIANMKGAAYEI
jgi:hypothetical protein